MDAPQQKPPFRWNELRDQFLMAAWGRFPLTQIAETLGCTEAEAERRARDLGLQE